MALLNRMEKLKRIPHIITGMIILLHSYMHFEEGHQSYVLFLIAGLCFLSVAIFHHRLLHIFPLVDIVFFCIEGLLSFVIAYEYFAAGKQALPYFYIVAGLMQISCIFIFMRRKRVHK